MKFPPIVLKDKDGDRLLKKFSQPRKPTKKDLRTRIRPEEDPVDGSKLYSYCLTDIASEHSLSVRIPDLPARELMFWKLHEHINRRGVQCDIESVQNAIAVIDQGYAKYNAEMFLVTEGAVEGVTKMAALLRFLNLHATKTLLNLDEDAVDAALKDPGICGNPKALRALQLRKMAGGAAVKKLYAMRNLTTPQGRLHDLFLYHKARTGRSAGADVQPQNLPNSGPKYRICQDAYCNGYFGAHLPSCPHCGADASQWSKLEDEWTREAAAVAISHLKHRSLDFMERVWGNAFEVIASCLRGMFIAGPGKELLCSDFNAIEAVVLAALAGEEWRLDVFRTHGKIYEMSASKITGIPFEEYIRYKNEIGQHHPTRKTIGKVAELACLRGDSLVLTKTGWVQISRLTENHLVWDGEQFVAHRGIVCRPRQAPYVQLDGLWITDMHQVMIEGDRWLPAHETRSRNALFLAQHTAAMMRPPGIDNYEVAYSIRKKGPDEVYDILNCGPNHRFMVKTEHGFLIVHNSGYQGWIGAWKAFGADKFFSDPEIKEAILAWRAASPMIVKLWEGLQDAAVQAVSCPDQKFTYRDISFYSHDDVLYMVLPSGRHLTYHSPRLFVTDRGNYGLSYETWNTNPKYGAVGWIRMETWGGRLTENAVQAASADILREAMLRIEAAGYPIVLHVHDEIVAEVPADFGSVEEFERLMTVLPGWAQSWPIRASGGWRDARYGK